MDCVLIVQDEEKQLNPPIGVVVFEQLWDG